MPAVTCVPAGPAPARMGRGRPEHVRSNGKSGHGGAAYGGQQVWLLLATSTPVSPCPCPCFSSPVPLLLLTPIPRSEDLLGGIAQGLEALCEASPVQEERAGEEGGVVNRSCSCSCSCFFSCSCYFQCSQRPASSADHTPRRQTAGVLGQGRGPEAGWGKYDLLSQYPQHHHVTQIYTQVNKRAASTPGLLPLAGCELVIVSTQPGEGGRVRAPTDTLVRQRPTPLIT